MLTKEELEHSFAQVKFTRPMNIDPPSLVETPTTLLLNALQENILIHIVYSYTEVRYLSEHCPNTPTDQNSITKLVKDISDSQAILEKILEKLNAVIISLFQTDFLKGQGKKFLSLLQPSQTPIIQSYILNLIILSFNSTEYTPEELTSYWEKLLSLSMESSGSVTKKFFILLTQIANRLAPIPHERISYTLPETPVPSTSPKNPANLKFLLVGRIPQAHSNFEEQTKRHAICLDATTYLLNSKIPPVRPSPINSLFVKTAALFPKFATFLANTLQLSTRAISATVQFSLAFTPTELDEDAQTLVLADIKRERDNLLLFSWGTIISTITMLNSSHFLEADLFIHFCIAANTPAVALQVFQKDVKLPEPVSLPNFGKFNSEPFQALPAAYSLGLEVSANMITFFSWRQAQFVTEKLVKGLSATASHGAPQVKQAAAFALSRFLRNMKDAKKNTQRAQSTTSTAINNGYVGLEEFELNERWSTSQTPEEPTAIHKPQHLENLKHFCEELGIVFAEKW